MAAEEDGWKDKVVFGSGRYAKLYVPDKKWYLFDQNGNKLAEGKSIREVDDKERAIK
jgi:hypothetical protein